MRLGNNVFWTRQARDDLRAIRDHIARDAPATAVAFLVPVNLTNVGSHRHTSTYVAIENRASLSLASNIAEGNGRFTKPDGKHFFGIARGSVQQCVPQPELARRRKRVSDENHAKLLQQLEEISRMKEFYSLGVGPTQRDSQLKCFLGFFGCNGRLRNSVSFGGNTGWMLCES